MLGMRSFFNRMSRISSRFYAQPEPIAGEILRLLEDSTVRGEQQRAQAAVIASLGERGAASRAAEAILAR